MLMRHMFSRIVVIYEVLQLLVKLQKLFTIQKLLDIEFVLY